MSTFKDVLCLLAIFVLYGIAGRLDYEDAVELEQIRQERHTGNCLTDLPAGHALARINDLNLIRRAIIWMPDCPAMAGPALIHALRGAPMYSATHRAGRRLPC
jgi:hypothetical protein